MEGDNSIILILGYLISPETVPMVKKIAKDGSCAIARPKP